MLRLDADTVVSNGEVYLPFLRHERYLDLSMFLRILYRVVHKNEDELAYLLLVCIDLQFLRQNFLDDNVLLLRKGAHDAHCLTGSGYDVHMRDFELIRLSVRSRDREEIADELRHFLHLVAHVLDDLLEERRGNGRITAQEIGRREHDRERRAQLMGGIGGKLTLAFIRLSDRFHRTAREHIANARGKGERDDTEYSERRSCLLHSVIHRRHVLADEHGLRWERRGKHCLCRHHHLRPVASLVRLRKYAYLSLGCVPRPDNIENEGLNAIGSA